MTLDIFDSRIVIKVRLNDEIRKSAIHNEELTFNELGLMVQRIYSDKINKSDEFVIKYTDEDSDLVTIRNDSDVTLAIESNKTLRLTVLLNKDEPVKKQTKEVDSTEIVNELQQIRKSIESFLEKFERSVKLTKPVEQQNGVSSEEPPKATTKVETKQPVNAVTPSIEKHIEFDPLVPKKVSRAGTPDSMSNTSIRSGSPSLRKNKFSEQQQVLQATGTMQPTPSTDLSANLFNNTLTFSSAPPAQDVQQVHQFDHQPQTQPAYQPPQPQQQQQIPINPQFPQLQQHQQPQQTPKPVQTTVQQQPQYPSAYPAYASMPPQPQQQQLAPQQQSQYGVPQQQTQMNQPMNAPQLQQPQVTDPNQQQYIMQQYYQQLQYAQASGNPYAKSPGSTMNRYPTSAYAPPSQPQQPQQQQQPPTFKQ